VPTPTPADEFDPDYRISSRRNINFRAGPGTNYEVVVVLAPGQPLQATGETAATANPARDGLPSGGLWRQFRTEDGETGWIRDVDVDPLNR
jgi:SH3-like domain-containing protein